jgi:hypothetical protein
VADNKFKGVTGILTANGAHLPSGKGKKGGFHQVLK